jgi:hypothetical protein
VERRHDLDARDREIERLQAHMNRASPVGVNVFVRVVVSVRVAVELPASFRIRRNRINREEPPRNGIVIPLLHAARVKVVVASFMQPAAA